MSETNIEAHDAATPSRSLVPSMKASVALLRQVWPLVLWLSVSLIVFGLAGYLLSYRDGQCLGLLVFVVFGWAVRPVAAPMEYTSLVFLTLCTTSSIVTWQGAWGGMASEGLWLIFCGMAMSEALKETKLCERVAGYLCRDTPSWPGLVVRLHLVGAVLALIVPSQVVRCQLVLPIARSVIHLRRVPIASRTSTAVIAALVICTNHCGEAVLTGSVPNIVAVGALERCNIEILWGSWFIRMAPTFWLCTLVMNISIVLLLVRVEQNFDEDTDVERSSVVPTATGPATQADRGGRTCNTVVLQRDLQQDLSKATGPATQSWSSSECHVITIFISSFTLWATDLIHGIRPITIGLCAVLILFAPRVGPVPFDAVRRLNFPVLIMVASVMAFGPVLASAPKAGGLFADATRSLILLVDGAALRHGALFVAALPLMLLVNVCVPVGVLTPEFCVGGGLRNFGLDARLGGMMLAAGGNCTILPFQNAPFLIAVSLSRDIILEKQFFKFLLANAIGTLLIIVPLTLAWWSMLGWST